MYMSGSFDRKMKSWPFISSCSIFFFKVVWLLRKCLWGGDFWFDGVYEVLRFGFNIMFVRNVFCRSNVE